MAGVAPTVPGTKKMPRQHGCVGACVAAMRQLRRSQLCRAGRGEQPMSLHAVYRGGNCALVLPRDHDGARLMLIDALLIETSNASPRAVQAAETRRTARRNSVAAHPHPLRELALTFAVPPICALYAPIAQVAVLMLRLPVRGCATSSFTSETRAASAS